LRNVSVDYSVPLSEIPSVLMSVVSETAGDAKAVEVPEHIDVEVKIAKEENPRDAGLEHLGRPSPFACPECHGVLLELSQEGRARFRCHIGHAYSTESLLAAMKEQNQHDLDTAFRGLEESALLLERMAAQLTEHGHGDAAAGMNSEAARARRQAEAVRAVVLESDEVSQATR
jgi:two-component system, chemotaxis family, protein-glutamate methylesterase/glutaminase